jgi:hypothetical protein
MRNSSLHRSNSHVGRGVVPGSFEKERDRVYDAKPVSDIEDEVKYEIRLEVCAHLDYFS